MTSEIKQRIEQIRRGEVPEEYKKIHGDIVPLTWDQISLADCIVPYEEKTSVANQYPVLTSSRKGLMLQTDYYSNRQVTTEDNVGYNIIPFGFLSFTLQQQRPQLCKKRVGPACRIKPLAL